MQNYIINKLNNGHLGQFRKVNSYRNRLLCKDCYGQQVKARYLKVMKDGTEQPRRTKYARQYREKYAKAREKHKARCKLYHFAYVKKEILVKPCFCGVVKVQGHHHNGYNSPLDVTWLCRKHHMQLHRKGAIG